MSRKLALVIGNSEYSDPTLAQLLTPRADVADLAEVLRQPPIGGFESVTPLVNATAAKIRLEIETFFAEKKPDDLLVLYFSGHGVRDDQGHLYLAVQDTLHNRLRATAIPASFVTGEMDRSRSRRQVLILDCCHSGAFAQGAKGALGASVGTASAFEGTGYGRVVLTATDSTQYAWEGDRVIGQAENSVFTFHLIEGLRTGAADVDADGRITLDELYSYVYEQVVTRTPKQTPGKWSYRQQGEIVIAHNPRPVIKAAPLPRDLQESLTDPRPWVREGAVNELARLLTGSHAGLALSAAEALQRLANDDSRRVGEAARRALPPPEAEQARAAREAAERYDSERQAPSTAAAQKAEEERSAQKAQRDEQERLARDQAEQERQARALADAERLAREQAEPEGQAPEKTAHAAGQSPSPDAGATQSPDEAWPEGARQLEAASRPPRLWMFVRAQRLPLALLALGWGLAIEIQQAINVSLYNSGADPAAQLWGYLAGGLIGAVATGAALRASGATGFTVTTVSFILGSWMAAQVMAAMVYLACNESLGIDESIALGLGVAGAVGGLGTGLALAQARQAQRPTGAQFVAIIFAGWTVAWALSAYLGLNVVNAFGDDPGHGAKTLILKLLPMDIRTALLLGQGLVATCLAAVYTLAGALGGGVMLWQLSREPKPGRR